MRKSGVWMVLGLALAGMWALSAVQDVQARPKYFATFNEVYPKLKEQAGGKKCNVCHIGATDKKTRNDYAKALHKALGGDETKNVLDAEKIKEALKKAEKEKSSEKDKTFGDLINDGKLPGKNP
jgi:hypothetical protein